MNNMNFDPMTGEPIQNNNIPGDNNTTIINQSQPISELQVEQLNTEVNNPNVVNNGALIQNQLQNIPTVDQDKEAFKIKEAYTTWRREADGILKVYISANPYSLFNPLFVDWNVAVNSLRKDSFYVGDTFVIHWAILSKELKESILELNPLYKFDEDYNQYAVEGTAINDANIRLGKLPQNFALQFVFRYQGKYIGIFKNQMIDEMNDRYFCNFITQVSMKRTSYCFDFEDMLEKTTLMSLDERTKLGRYKTAMRRNLVSFEDINVYYYCVEIYKNI